MKTLLVMLAALPAVAAAQEPERNTFYLLSGNDTVIAERVWRTATELRGEFVDRARGARMEYIAALRPDGLISRLTTRFHRVATDTAFTEATFEMAGDHVLARMGNSAPAKIPGVAEALPIVNPSIAFLEQLVLRARFMGGSKLTIPLFIVGAPQPVPAVVTLIGSDSAALDYAGVSMRVALSPTGRIIGGGMPAQRLVFVRAAPVERLASVRRDYSAPRDAPYVSEDVEVRTASGLRLTGTLTLPRARPEGRVPAIVTITGSGPEDRDEEPVGLSGYRPFRELADTLGRRGVAVLRLDDRGINGSDAGPPTVTSSDFADDVRAAVAYLRTRPEIDADRIALVGHSEGGFIAPLVAESDPRIRAMVLLAAPASTGRAIVRSQQHYMIDTVGKLTGAARDTAFARAERAADSMAARLPWMRFFMTHDPSEIARRVKTPVLILHGETDHQVPSTEAEKLAAAFRAAGNSRVDVRLFPETNHLFVADKIGGFSYEKLPSLAVRREVLGTIAEWLSERFR